MRFWSATIAKHTSVFRVTKNEVEPTKANNAIVYYFATIPLSHNEFHVPTSRCQPSFLACTSSKILIKLLFALVALSFSIMTRFAPVILPIVVLFSYV